MMSVVVLCEPGVEKLFRLFWVCMFVIMLLMALCFLCEASGNSGEGLIPGVHVFADAEKDYVYLWNANGVRKADADGTYPFFVQTPHYILGFKPEKASFTTFQVLPGLYDTSNYQTHKDNLVDENVIAGLTIKVVTEDGEYTNLDFTNHSGQMQILDAGKYLYKVRVGDIFLSSEPSTGLLARLLGKGKSKWTGVYAELLFYFWADEIFMSGKIVANEDLKIRQISVSLTLDKQFSDFLIASEDMMKTGVLSHSYYDVYDSELVVLHNGQSGVAITACVKEEFESIRVRTTLESVEYTAIIFDETQNDGEFLELKKGYLKRFGLRFIPLYGGFEGVAQGILEEEKDIKRFDEWFEIIDKTFPGTPRVSYDEKAGYFVVSMRQEDVGRDYKRDEVNHYEGVRLRVHNPSSYPRRVRIGLHKDYPFHWIPGGLPIVRDGDGYPVGLSAQVSKNWHGIYYHHSYTVVTLQPGETQEFLINIVYENWGTKPVVSFNQLSLEGFDSDPDVKTNLLSTTKVNTQLWFQMGQGIAESICYDPDAIHLENVLTDYRPVYGEPFANDDLRFSTNVGGGDFLHYLDKQGRRVFLAGPKVDLTMYGPNMSDVTFNYLTEDGKIHAQIEIIHVGTADATKGWYKIRYEVIEDVEYRKFSIYSLGAPRYNAASPRLFAYGNIDGGLKEIRQVDLSRSGYWFQNLHFEDPGTWFALYKTSNEPASPQGGANRGIILRQYQAVINGEENNAYYINAFRSPGPVGMAVTLEIEPANDVKRLKAGDYIEALIELIVYNKGDEFYHGPDEVMRRLLKEGDSYYPVLWEAIHNQLNVEVYKGELLLDTFPVTVRVDDNLEAEILVSGGMGYIPLVFCGLHHYRGVVLEEYIDGNWKQVEQAVKGNDYWQVRFDTTDRTFTFVYTVLSQPQDDNLLIRRFRIREAMTHDSEA